MQALVEMLLALIDVLKAEGALARRALARLALALGLIAGAALFMLITLGLLLAAFYLILVPYMPAGIAMLLTGLLAGVATGGLLWLGMMQTRR